MLFVDDYHVHSSQGVERVFHRLEQHPANPIHVFTDPWGPICVDHGGYERDPQTGEFVLWYYTRPDHPEGMHESAFVCQARSRDGIHWNTPSLGIHEFRGSRENNICVVNFTASGVYPGPHELTGPCITRDPLDPNPDGRYKMALWRYNRDRDPETGKRLYARKDTSHPTGLYTSTSPDGIHWPDRERLVHTFADGFGDTYTFMVDTLRRGYRLFGKRMYWDHDRDMWIRLRHTTWSPDFVSWSPFVPILPIDEHDRPHDQIYMNNGYVYDDMYLGFARILHAHDDWSLDIDLAYSRDGEEWIRPPAARCILPRGVGDTWDSGRMAMFPSAPLRAGDRLYFYHTSGAWYHSPAPLRELPPGTERPRGLCLATLRVDGFAGLRAAGSGHIRTRPLFMEREQLRINVDASQGVCRVGLLDEAGFPIAGYTPADMAPIQADAIDHRLRWREHDSVADLYGRWLSLDIRLERAELFSIRQGG